MKSVTPFGRTRSPCLGLWWFAIVLLLDSLPNVGIATEPEFTSIAEVRLLSRLDASKAHPVRIRGVVTYCDTLWGSLYLQDGDQGILVRFFRTEITYRPGTRVEVEGVTQEHLSPVEVCIGDAKLKVIGEAELPPPREARATRTQDGEALLRRSRVSGIIQQADQMANGRWVFVLRNGEETLPCHFREGVPEEFDPLSLLDAEVSICGIVQPAINTDPKQKQVVLVAHDFKDLAMTKPPPPAPFAAPVTPIAKLSTRESHAVRVRARVLSESKKHNFTVRDATGTLPVHTSGNCWVQPSETVDLIGFLATTAEGRQFFATQIGLVQRNGPTDPKRGPTALPTIFDIATLRKFDPTEAEKGYPVRVRGVVTHRHPKLKDLFIQDGRNGIYVENGPEPVPINKLVEVEGFSDPGGVLTMIRATRVRVIGDADPTPFPQRISMYDVQTGNLDCNLVQIEGVVQEVKIWEKHLVLVLMTRLGYVEVCTAEGSVEEAQNLVDARVRAVGVYSVIPDRFRQVTGYRIFTSFLSQVEVLDPAPLDPFEQKTLEISQLTTATRDHVGPHRVKIRGTVIGVARSGWVYVQNGRTSMRVMPAEPGDFRSGDTVEAVGFMSLGKASPQLRGALFRKLPERRIPKVESISVRDALDGKTDGQLVSITPRYLNHFARDGDAILLVQADSTVFEVLVGNAEGSNRFDRLEHGTLIEVTGICVLHGDRIGGIRSFRIESSDPELIRVVEMPKSWVSPFARWLVGLGLGLLLLTLGWVALLRGQVRRQTAQIRERLESETKLEARYRDLCEHARDMIFSVDARGTITSFNRAGEQITGFDREQVIGKRLQELILPGEDEKLNSSFHADASPFEMRFRRSDGEVAIFEVSSRPLVNDGQLVGFEAIARDVTQRKQIEENLRQSAKMQAIGQLAGGIAHDFNNLLTVINGYSDLVIGSLHPESPHYDSLVEIGKAGDRAASLTQQLLAFSRRSIITPRLLSLNESVREMEKMLRRLIGETIRLTTDLDEDLPHSHLDSGLVGQILVNLSVNSRDAMPQGGELTIRTRTLDAEYIRLEVRDTGCGMDRETQRHIFEPYFTTKPVGQGTGLGLATVFGIVETSEGRIEVESEVGKGTTFRIDFPIAGLPEDDDLHAPPAPEPPEEGACVILLVEDDPNVRSLEHRVLEMSGFRVLVAETGAEALEVLDRAEEKPDLLVTDVIMPEMNGRELSERVRSILPSISILFLSGYTNDEILRMGVLTEEANFLHKPFKPQDLIRKIREILQTAMVGSWHGS